MFNGKERSRWKAVMIHDYVNKRPNNGRPRMTVHVYIVTLLSCDGLRTDDEENN